MTNAEHWQMTSPVSEMLAALRRGERVSFTSANPAGEGWYGYVAPDGSRRLWCEGQEQAQRYSVDVVADVLCRILAGEDPGPYHTLDSSLRITH